MRLRLSAVGLVLSCAGALAVPSVQSAQAEPPDPGGPDGTVSQQDVDDARAAVDATAGDVDAVRAQLAVAEQRLEAAQVDAAKAAEAFNGARYEAEQTAEAARLAQAQSEAAAADLERQRAAYASAVTSAYQMSPQLTGLGAISQADGITEVLESTSALQNAQAGLEDRFDSYDAASTVAVEAATQAEAALEDARAATDQARESRDAASAAADAAEQQAATFAGERDQLIARLAHLQDISVELAGERQDQLEAQAAAEAAAAAQQAAEEQAAQEAAEQAAQQAADEAAAQQAAEEAAAQQAAEEAAQQATPTPTPTATATPTPTSTPTPTATPTTPPPPVTPTVGDAGAAIAFARTQLGKPYSYGAAGPDSWDCSGLTMMAWAAGGKALPHYSVAQYGASTAITLAELQPGDLMFWGGSSASSIYHVAIYTGDGMMIHAPRPGKNVQEVSMYEWITPNYFARP
jgi:cell wall-associated NlpC family hydrolase